MSKFNEDSRVKIPAILHLIRLGYEYKSLKNAKWDLKTNIFTDIYKESITKINNGLNNKDTLRTLEELKITLDNEDLGKAFYERITNQSLIKILDLEDFSKNSFHVVTELPYRNGDEEFRPDITILVNGLPLIFIEVKKPNNKEGILAEHDRIIKRFQNSKFKRFINITQLMIFSNNMEYNTDSGLTLEGAFYATTSYKKPTFNFFREESKFDLKKLLLDEDNELENNLLKDNNLTAIKYNQEFLTNKNPLSPTNRILTSLLSRNRLHFILKYSLTYIKELNNFNKHIMRYPQVFGTLAIKKNLDEDIKKGIIWHTQGSGKTALAYYNVRFLTDFYKQKKIIPKFYFIVDRLDLLVQAKREFNSRGLSVHTINTRDEFAKEIKSITVVHNSSGKSEITVVNIQKFKDDPNVIRNLDYDLKVQRIYFLDEVHRSYNPKGSFLANLSESDKNAIKIGLTGTPLLGTQYNSKILFGNYIHKYYYNSSIADGYTLRLIREEIESNYKMVLKKAINDIEVIEGEINKKYLYSHPRFVEPMLDYIINDFQKSKTLFNANNFGGMVVCDSSEQAKEMYKIFSNKYSNVEGSVNKNIKSALILHDVDNKEIRKDNIEDFKAGKIDLLFVYNMLITGFDSPRLKKLYLGRVIKKHNLLQALTRVNRPYKNFKYGYVVDFADIKKEFDATNKAYFDELQNELGDELKNFSNLFKSKEEIEKDIEKIKDILFYFDTNNAENFSKQISQIYDPKEIQSIKKALTDSKDLYNLIRLFGHYEILEKLDFKKLGQLYREVSNHLELINLKNNLENNTDTSNLLNLALEDVLFMFKKVKEEELVLADKYKNTLRKTREALARNIDQNDPKFISLREELERIFKKKNLNDISQKEMNENIEFLNKIYNKVDKLNRENNFLASKYNNDEKFARIHKRIMSSEKLKENDRQIHSALSGVKIIADEALMQNNLLLNNEVYFVKKIMPVVIDNFKNKNNINIDPNSSKFINNLIVKEYMQEFNYGYVK